MSYLDSNKISYNTISINQNNNRNDSFNNNHHQTYISSLNKNNLKNQIKSNFSLTNQKKMYHQETKTLSLYSKADQILFLRAIYIKYYL